MNYFKNLSGLIASTCGSVAIIRIENSTYLINYTVDSILVETDLHQVENSYD